MAADSTPDIEALRQRHKELDRQKTTEEANLSNARKVLDDLRKQASQQYGTDDLEKLRVKLAEMEAENERKRAEYHAHLQEIQEKLEEVKRQFTANAAEQM